MEIITLLLLCIFIPTSQATAGPIVAPNSAMEGFGAADTRYVNITGDVMSGPLQVSSLTVTGAASVGTTLGVTGILSGSEAKFSTSLTAATGTITGNAFSVGGSTLVVSAGQVGIGKTPTQILDIGLNQNADTTLSLSNTTAGTASRAMFNANTSGGGAIDLGMASPSYTGVASWSGKGIITTSAHLTLSAYAATSSMTFQTGGTADRMVIDKNGNVGIGTTAPSGLLSVMQPAGTAKTTSILIVSSAAANIFNINADGGIGINKLADRNVDDFVMRPTAANFGFSLRESDDGFNAASLRGGSTGGALALYSAGSSTNGVSLTGNAGNNWINSGNLGIGTVAPSTKLDVLGTTQLTGAATVVGSMTVTAVTQLNGNVLLGEPNYVKAGSANRQILWATNSGANNGTYLRCSDNDVGDGVHIQTMAGTDIITALDTGYVGIGTTVPVSKLTVSSGTITVDGTGAAIALGGRTQTIGYSGVAQSSASTTGATWAIQTYETCISSIVTPAQIGGRSVKIDSTAQITVGGATSDITMSIRRLAVGELVSRITRRPTGYPDALTLPFWIDSSAAGVQTYALCFKATTAVTIDSFNWGLEEK